MKSRLRRSLRRLSVAAATVAAVGALTAVPAPAHAADNPYQRGPDPTERSVTARRGPFAIDEISVNGGIGAGFNRGTIFYPTDRSQGTFGAVAVIPGFLSPESLVRWFGPRLASQGFVVMTLTTNGLTDTPESRSEQLLAALDYLTTRSQVRDRIDPSRLAVMGHSMGGGGSLAAAAKRPTLRAAIPLAPWSLTKNWSDLTVPTLIIGAENDNVAPVAGHSERFYDSMTNVPEKAYLEMAGGNHVDPTAESDLVAKFTISWLKRFVDDDTRYDQFLCPAPRPNRQISEYRDTCPHS
ncbi:MULTISPECIES: dienelactone hydrolase family protein [Thermomonospora]|uniref:Poly(ethylene terephthalate) hydrolase n=1 Tax=Thermomonospora curvata (strain ATCC 19995 / DSM 43183 / JCM 3096 / KCTC 9072 / NBRC 15933 / NCIMB 10081 / Henssen B9) TaxID=471852 RepID=D1A646_THECD|nr:MULTISPECIES: dienelactone hydrolase family protein [Thermomonospora]ACZ00145.1 Triacylglycerol lipase [Thermomonospora curvata DSM 43183]PKK11965.1 MAG: alpha/beta hydrolase [Thermomonospora sp. CIF 1]